MDKSLFIFNRSKILNNMLDNSVLLGFSIPKGEVKNDVNRNYFYLCGNFEFENIVMLVKKEGVTKELMFINPYDEFKAKWVGAPLSKEEIYNQSGIEDIHYLEESYLLNQLRIRKLQDFILHIFSPPMILPFLFCRYQFLIDNIFLVPQFTSVQSLSHVQLFATPWTTVRQASVHHQFLELAQTHVH